MNSLFAKLSGLDEIVIFNSLERADVKKIVDIPFDKLKKRVQKTGAYRYVLRKLMSKVHPGHAVGRGWERHSGLQTREKLDSLDLGDVAEVLAAEGALA